MSAKNGNGIGADVPQFGTPPIVSRVLDDIQKIETKRALDRALIDSLFNGGRPFGEKERQKYQIEFNVNFNGGNRMLQDANRQVNNALIPSGNFFHGVSRGGTVSRRQDYSEKFTKRINCVLKEGEPGRHHSFLLKSRNASFCIHGIGALVWLKDYRWMPRFVGLEDLLIPTDTLCDLSNLTHFGVNLYLTPGELYRMSHGDRRDEGWNINAVNRIMQDLKDDESQPIFSQDEHTWHEQPEKIEEIFKQNRGWMESDSVPKVKLRMFFYSDPVTGKWYRKVILRESTPSQAADKEFIYDGKQPYADRLSNILHVLYGDNSIIAPLKHHSVRGLGVMLYSQVEADNRLHCQFFQHVFENLKMYFRKTDKVDRGIQKFLELYQYSVIQDGFEIIPANERHQVNDTIVQMAMNQLKQSMVENSASFSNSVENQPNKRMTAKEYIGRLNTASVMISGMLDMAYMQETFYYQELVRRFCDPASTDPSVKAFQDGCKEDGIPSKLMVASNWQIIPDRVFGNGDPTLAQAQAEWLIEHIDRFEPESQRRILRNAVSVTLDNPDMADLLVPSAPMNATTGTFAAEDVFATLMRGIPIKLRQGIDHIGYVKALLGMMNVTVHQITQAGNVGNPADIIGLVTCGQEVQQHLSIIEGQEKDGKQIVKQFGDMLGNIMNQVKAFAQRQQEQKQQDSPQLDPEVMAKIQGMIAMDRVKTQSKEAATQQRLAHTEARFQQQQKIKAGQALADTQLQAMKAVADQAASKPDQGSEG